MPITSDINSIEENVMLVESVLIRTQARRDFAFQKKLILWLYQHIEEEEARPDPSNPTIVTLIPAIKNIFHKFQSEDSANPAINILTNTFNEFQAITNPVLSQIAIDLIIFIKNQKRKLDNQQQLQKFNTGCNNLFD